MKADFLTLKGVVHFSRWSGKGYAIFAALGRQVRISGLPISICLQALQKTARKGGIVMSEVCWEEKSETAEAGEQQREKLYFWLKQGEVCPEGWKYDRIYRRGYVGAYPLF